jgi:hypothetical protein
MKNVTKKEWVLWIVIVIIIPLLIYGSYIRGKRWWESSVSILWTFKSTHNVPSKEQSKTDELVESRKQKVEKDKQKIEYEITEVWYTSDWYYLEINNKSDWIIANSEYYNNAEFECRIKDNVTWIRRPIQFSIDPNDTKSSIHEIKLVDIQYNIEPKFIITCESLEDTKIIEYAIWNIWVPKTYKLWADWDINAKRFEWLIFRTIDARSDTTMNKDSMLLNKLRKLIEFHWWSLCSQPVEDAKITKPLSEIAVYSNEYIWKIIDSILNEIDNREVILSWLSFDANESIHNEITWRRRIKSCAWETNSNWNLKCPMPKNQLVSWLNCESLNNKNVTFATEVLYNPIFYTETDWLIVISE